MLSSHKSRKNVKKLGLSIITNMKNYYRYFDESSYISYILCFKNLQTYNRIRFEKEKKLIYKNRFFVNSGGRL